MDDTSSVEDQKVTAVDWRSSLWIWTLQEVSPH
jgi:hypothetical protein